MKIVWNERSWRWFRDASRYTGYDRRLAALLLEHIPRRGTLCDVGCGAALVDFELAPHFQRISCVDISPEILRFVDGEIKRLGLDNIGTLCADGGELDGRWDTVISLFHGGADAVFRYLPLAGDRLLLATHGARMGNFDPGRGGRRCFDAESTSARLDRAGIKYRLLEAEFEYGQPLRSLEDAEAFLRAYGPTMEDGALGEYMERVLTPTGREDFPYYLPKKRAFGLFVIRRDENEV